MSMVKRRVSLNIQALHTGRPEKNAMCERYEIFLCRDCHFVTFQDHGITLPNDIKRCSTVPPAANNQNKALGCRHFPGVYEGHQCHLGRVTSGEKVRIQIWSVLYGLGLRIETTLSETFKSETEIQVLAFFGRFPLNLETEIFEITRP